MLTLSYLNPGSVKFDNYIKNRINFTLTHQLLDADLWSKFVDVYRTKSDDGNLGWRCEYWGKMMRGACLIYHLCPSEKLYKILYDTTADLLTVQDSLGRFTTYKDEFICWDMWGRKYIITSLLHFYKICKDEVFKNRVLIAVKRHADYILEKVGLGKEQLGILDTSEYWGGLNSASICETFVNLYKITKEEKYLNFAKYILSTGGCRDGNLIELALENKKAPFEYPVKKAYEMMSFFEGSLEYYSITHEEKYLKAFKNFIYKVRETDITAIGCAGCYHELFDNSAIKQTEKSDVEMQETCVTVTWMRILSKYYLITGEKWCLDYIEKSAINALYSAMNTMNQKAYSWESKQFHNPLPFDSYAPLSYSRHGIFTAGCRPLNDGTIYGCCACIGSAGVALYPLNAHIIKDNQLLINYLLPCQILDNNADIEIVGNYLIDKKIIIKINSLGNYESINVRIPTFVKSYKFNTRAMIDGGYIICKNTGEYVLNLEFGVTYEVLNNKVLFKYGQLVLGQDGELNPKGLIDIDLDNLDIKETKPVGLELVRFNINGNIFVNYSELGKCWDNKTIVTIWNKIK